MRMGGRPGAPRALAVPTGPLGSAGPPQLAANIFSCIPERLTENWLPRLISANLYSAPTCPEDDSDSVRARSSPLCVDSVCARAPASTPPVLCARQKCPSLKRRSPL